MRLITSLLLLVILLIPAITPTPARAQDGGDPGAQTNTNEGNLMPPQLMLVILLDDTSTMHNVNSAASAGYATAREPSDPRDTRDQAVIAMLSMLASDQLRAHKVAVLRFGADDDFEWLAADADNPFYVVGGSNYDPTAPASSYQELKTRLDQRYQRAPTGGPGDIGAVLETAEAMVGRQIGSGDNLKPAMVLITDDVPMTGPWRQPGTANPWYADTMPDLHDIWLRYIEAMDTGILETLRGYQQYTGYCQAAFGGETGGIPVAVIGLGNASWVSDTGTILAGFGPASYYQSRFVQKTRAASLLDPGQMLYYPVDFNLDLDDIELRQDFIAAGTDIIRELRCIRAPELRPVSQADVLTSTLELPVSNLYRQVRLVMDIANPDAAPPAIQTAAGSVYTRDAPGDARLVTIPPVADGEPVRDIWTFVPESAWAGTWTITIPGDAPATVTAEVELRYNDLELITSGQLGQQYMTSETVAVTLELKAGGLPINVDTDPLIDEVMGRLADGNWFQFRYESGVLQHNLSSEDKSREGSLSLEVRVDFDDALLPPGTTWTHTFEQFIRLAEEISMGDVVPLDNAVWTCEKSADNREFGQRVTVELITPDSLKDTEGIFNYVAVWVYAADPSITGIEPVGRLLWRQYNDEAEGGGVSNEFSGVVPCEVLSASGQPARIWIRAIFDDETELSGSPRQLSYILNPTATPPPTSVVPTSRPPTPTPPPPAAPDPLDQVKDTVDADSPVTRIVLVILALIGLVAALRVLQFARWHLMPLSYVSIKDGEKGKFEPLLRGIWWVFPVRRGWRITDRQGRALFRIAVAPHNHLDVRAFRENSRLNHQALSRRSSTRVPLRQFVVYVETGREPGGMVDAEPGGESGPDLGLDTGSTHRGYTVRNRRIRRDR
ncbi:MAG: hypothetical protein JXQ72_17495 [Anaerolineae bacterium]|nr:hypothetical protein [Anaerolineae bacterium]